MAGYFIPGWFRPWRCYRHRQAPLNMNAHTIAARHKEIDTTAGTFKRGHTQTVTTEWLSGLWLFCPSSRLLMALHGSVYHTNTAHLKKCETNSIEPTRPSHPDGRSLVEEIDFQQKLVVSFPPVASQGQFSSNQWFQAVLCYRIHVTRSSRCGTGSESESNKSRHCRLAF